MISMGLSLGGYIIPYFFIYQPAILMQAGALSIIRVLFTVIIAMFFIEAGVFGYPKKPATLLERLLFIIGGLFLLNSTLLTDLLGISLVGAGLLLHYFVPYIPIIGKRAEDVEKVDLSHLKWDKNENIMDLQAS